MVKGLKYPLKQHRKFQNLMIECISYALPSCVFPFAPFFSEVICMASAVYQHDISTIRLEKKNRYTFLTKTHRTIINQFFSNTTKIIVQLINYLFYNKDTSCKYSKGIILVFDFSLGFFTLAP